MTQQPGKGGDLAPRNESREEGQRWSDGIAIIGMAARFPRSRNVHEYWNRLLAGELLISEYSREELIELGIDTVMLDNPNYVFKGTSIDDADCLDAPFFGFSRREAEIIDPQQRIFLECAWEALENSGYRGDRERTGVFAGVGPNVYLLQLMGNPGVMASAGGYQVMLGNDKDYLASRVAYKLNLRGPAVVVQAACATSLAAVHQACRSILDGECDMALAGGASIIFPQAAGYLYMPGMILSPDGYCRPFDAAAGGTVPSRGVGVVVLKRLSQALADEDQIYAVIRGSAWNNDGSEKVGYTVPSVDGQAAVIHDALAAAGITADRIGYVEAHGTATELGDPIEFTALKSVFLKHHAKPGSCVIGAVKSNMGHADAASGVAGLIKAALAVQSGIIPPTLHFNQPNPYIEFEGGPFVISSSAQSWSQSGERWAGVSSFGIGGTNVHAILSSAPQRKTHPSAPSPHIFPLSAFTPTALATTCEHLANHLNSDPSLPAEDVASTLQLGRRAFPFRRAIVARDCSELVVALHKPLGDREVKPLDSRLDLRDDVVYLFPGQGQQFPGMAAELYRTDPEFRVTIDEGAVILRGELDFDVLECIAGSGSAPGLREQLQETDKAQPVLFLVEYALATRWLSLGIRPAALLGHSLGELTAAAVAGVFSFHDGLRLAATRGRLMAQTPPGIMLAVTLPPEKLSAYIEQDVWIAAENGAKMSVASGLVEPMQELERRLQLERIACVRLASKNPFHTPWMADAAKAFHRAVESVPRHSPSIPWLSNVTGTWIETGQAQSAQYWGSQIVSSVRFTRNLAELADRRRFLLEVGPGEALIGIARHQLQGSKSAASLGAENRRKSDRVFFLEAAAGLWESGAELDWRAIAPNAGRRRVPLPTYPFERQRYWIEPSSRAEAPGILPSVFSVRPTPRADTPEISTAKRPELSSWFYAPSWQSTPPASIALQQESPIDCWMVLLDRSGLAQSLIAGLRQQGAEIVMVSAATQFASSDEGLAINPEQPGDYERLWQKLATLGIRPAGLLNLWTTCGMNVPAYDSLVLLLQSAGRHRQRFQQIEIITDRLESLFGELVEEVDRSQILGLASTLMVEYPNMHCRHIDVSLSADEINRTANWILDETASTARNLSIAYRNGNRWQKNWTPAPLRKSSAAPFRHGGIYLITGGIGGIGFSVAHHLLRDYQARVVLTGRTALPEPAQWAAWTADHGEEDPVTRRIRRLQDLQQAGGELDFVAADVCDKDAMAQVFARVHSRFGKIDGVIHAAGLAAGGMVAAQNLEAARETRRPKVQGSIVLAELLRGTDPDFFLMCSSLSSIIPAATQAAYAAANAFQNYFAAYCRNTMKLPAVAIDFDAWQEVGMAAEMVLPEGFESAKEERLRTAMSVSEGIEVIHRVLAAWHGPQIFTATVPLETLLLVQTPAPEPRVEASPSLPQEGPDTELAAVSEIWKELLATDSIEPSDNFFELGGHSLMGTMVLARIQDRFGVVLSLRTLFESPTAQALADSLRIARAATKARQSPNFADEGREVFEL
jgi:acyl transferase domain-containing protein/acyl carrier protein